MMLYSKRWFYLFLIQLIWKKLQYCLSGFFIEFFWLIGYNNYAGIEFIILNLHFIIGNTGFCAHVMPRFSGRQNRKTVFPPGVSLGIKI